MVTFPLAFSPMEYYYWCDDRRDYPACFPLELQFSGALDRHRFATAWTAALDRHPLLRALVDDSGPRPIWIEGKGRPLDFDWAEEGVAISGLRKRLDLTQQPGIQCWLRTSSNSSRVLLRFHHACCDGLGALQFVEDLLVHYHREVHGHDSEVMSRPLQPQQLARRATLAQIAERPSFWLTLRYAAAIARFWAPHMLRRPAPLMRSTDRAEVDTKTADHGFVTELLDKDTVKSLRQKATSRGVALNSLLLHDLFVVLGKWQIDNNGRAADRLCVNVPVSLRRAGDRVLPAANRLSYAFVTRRVRDCCAGAVLLQSIHEEMTTIQNKHMALRFLGGVTFAGRFRGMLTWFLDRKRVYATIVLSNLGRVLTSTRLPRRQGRLVCGDVVLQQVSGVPPIRPLTRAAIAVISYADEVAVCLQGDLDYFDAGQVSKLLALYVARLKQTASDSGGSAVIAGGNRFE